MKGLIHIYCGDGKGKTTAAMGLALRSAGAGRRVLVLQFFKDGNSSEVKALKNFATVDVVEQTRRFGFSWTLSEEELREAKAYYSSLLEDAMAKSKEYDLLVLDEAMSACTTGMIQEERLLELLREKPDAMEVVMTGRNPSQALMDQAGSEREREAIRRCMG